MYDASAKYSVNLELQPVDIDPQVAVLFLKVVESAQTEITLMISCNVFTRNHPCWRQTMC